LRDFVVDSFNLIYKIRGLEGGVARNFFNQLYFKAQRFKPDRWFLLFDSKPTEKRKIDETYKQNRGDVYDSLAGDVDDIVRLARVFPNVHVVQHEGFESDDIAYNLCRTLERPIVWSDDIDWIVNFTVNPNVTWIRNKKLYTRMNFTGSFGFSFEKIPLYLFLLGDSKDSVSQPLRLKGPIEESVLHHADIADYLAEIGLVDKHPRRIEQNIGNANHAQRGLLAGDFEPDIVADLHIRLLFEKLGIDHHCRRILRQQ